MARPNYKDKIYRECKILPSTQIRVLRLQPSSQPSAIVHVTLDVVSLNREEPPAYNALSYCWGDASKQKIIILNGFEISVTASLESALKHLRKANEVFTVWADAVCINQDDLDEKKIQVQMMDQVYKKADLVIVWLGLADDDSDLAMNACEEWGSLTPIGEKGSQKDEAETSKDAVPIKLIPRRKYILSQVVYEKFNQSKWQAVRHLFDREYWQRLWIYQEIQLAQKVIVKCGNKEVAWENFAGLNRAWDEIYRKHILFQKELSSSTWELISNCGINRLDMFFDHALTGLKRQQESFYQVLRRTANQKCTDGRDRMYAILKIPRDGDSYPEPDYTADVTITMVYRKYAVEYIKQTGSLEWLNEASCRKHQSSRTMLNLPSWVPNWSVKPHHGIVLLKYGEMADWYYASQLFDVFGRDSTLDISTQDETDPTDDPAGDGAGTAEGTQPTPITQRYSIADVEFSKVFEAGDSIIRPPGILCDTISRVASPPALQMGYMRMKHFIEQGSELRRRGRHPNGLPIFNVLYRISLMGIYPVKTGLPLIYPITESDMTSDLARGFLLKVACDFGYLREIPEKGSGLTMEGGFGTYSVARYRWAKPWREVDFPFWDLNTKAIVNGTEPASSDEIASLSEDKKKFATFQTFIEAEKKESYDAQLVSYWFLIHHWQTRAKEAIEGRNLFITKHGLIGLATNDQVQPKDLVTVLYGGKTPYILRHEGWRMDCGSVHTLVSDAYIYGLMEGEAFTHAERWEHDDGGKPIFQDFAIM